MISLKHIFYSSAIAVVLGVSGCVNDLNVSPIDPNIESSDQVYNSEADFASGLAKIYAGFAVSGQEGPAGQGDINNFDEGQSQYWRAYFTCQEYPTDEAICAWNDGNLPAMSQVNWDANNEFIKNFYYRVFYQVAYANEFIRQANKYGKDEYKKLPRYRAEARCLRALAYWHALDLFGNGVPFTTEENEVGSNPPMPAGKIPGPELFNYIESELKDIIDGEGAEQLLNARQGYVGQADKGLAWMILAKLYLNHKVYLGKEDLKYYTAAKDYLKKIIDEGGYSLVQNTGNANYTDYELLFMADNEKRDNEIIFSINQDGFSSQNYGGMSFVINSAIGGDVMDAPSYGTNGGWGGHRSTKALYEKFQVGDDREALFFKEGQTLDIVHLDQFKEGYAIVKFKNIDSNGNSGSNQPGGFVDTNIPVFRLADAYLMLAEVELRLGGPVSEAFPYIEQIRERAHAKPVTSGEIDLDWILDERARELYWECHRRTDLIRFDKFTKNYNWPFKGGSANGSTSINDKYNLMPIPFTDITANPNLDQNNGY